MKSMTVNKFIRESSKILERFENEVIPFSDNKEEQKKRKEKASKDFFYFFQTYLPHYCENKTFPDFYYDVNNIFEKDERSKINSFAAPRGFSKSTYFFARIIHAVCVKKVKFIIYVSATKELAVDFVSFIKMEFEDNPRIKQDFGDLIKGIGSVSNFSANGVRVFARTKRQMLRGFKFRNRRPDWIIIDDVEKDEDAGSPVLVKKLLKIITEGLYPSLRPAKTSKFFIFGTIINRRSALGTILNSQEEPYINWNRRVYKSISISEDGKEKSLWQDRFPIKLLQEIKKTIGTIAFEKEYQNNPLDEEVSAFQESWMKYYDLNSINPKNLIKVMFLDPAARDKKKNDTKAIILLGLDKEEMKYYFLHVWIKRASIISMLHAVFRIYLTYFPSVVGFESNGFQALIKDLFENLEREYKVNLPLMLIEHYQSKEMRILSLSPLMERGKFYFKSNPDDDTKILIEQFIYYPTSTINDDGPDASAEARKICDSFTCESKFTPGKTKGNVKLFSGYGKIDEWRKL
jgi:phage terminase large subunit-like protein